MLSMQIVLRGASRFLQQTRTYSGQYRHLAQGLPKHPPPTFQRSQVPLRNQPSSHVEYCLRRPFASSPWPPPARSPVPSRHPKMRTTPDGYTRFTREPSSRPQSPLTRYILYITAGGIGIYIYSMVDYAPFTGRMRLLGVSRSAEMELGRRAFEDLLYSFGPEHLLPARDPRTIRVRRVVTRLARTANAIDDRLAEGFRWAVVVADVPEPNAMCVPGGRILVTTGLLDILPSDDDVAVVVGHEIAHALVRHGVESMSLQRLLWPIVMIANQVFDTRVLPSMFVTLFLSLPYSRKLEYEADTVGLILCTESCYDPRVAPGVFQRLARLQEVHEEEHTGGRGKIMGRLGSFFSTHPQSDERARRLEGQLAKLMPVFNDKCAHGHTFSTSMSHRDYTRV